MHLNSACYRQSVAKNVCGRRRTSDDAMAEAPGTIDQLVEAIQAKTGAAMPGTDLLLSNSFDVLTSDLVEGHHVGHESGDR